MTPGRARFGRDRAPLAAALLLLLFAAAAALAPLLAVLAVLALANGVNRPVLSTLLSLNATPSEQGLVLGLSSSCASLARIEKTGMERLVQRFHHEIGTVCRQVGGSEAPGGHRKAAGADGLGAGDVLGCVSDDPGFVRGKRPSGVGGGAFQVELRGQAEGRCEGQVAEQLPRQAAACTPPSG